MAAIAGLLGSIIPLLLLMPLIQQFIGGGLFGAPQTRSVEKGPLTAVNTVTLQKTFSSTRRFYHQIFARIKNSGTSAVTTTVKVGAFLSNETDDISEGQIVYADNVTIPAGGYYAFTVTSPIINPQLPDPYLNKWIKLQLGTNLDVLIFQYSESEI